MWAYERKKKNNDKEESNGEGKARDMIRERNWNQNKWTKEAKSKEHIRGYIDDVL